MDRRSWLWRRKSSEKSPGETESTGSVSSHWERFSDDQVYSTHSTQSPDVESKAGPSDEQVNDNVKTLTEKLSAALLNIRAKEELVKQHAKVAEEAVTGWEKAENEAATLKKQLEVATKKSSSLESRVAHLDEALKECVRQLRQAREEQDQKIHEVVERKTSEWESKRSELEVQLQAAKAKAGARNDSELSKRLEVAEKKNSELELELQSRYKELEFRIIERDLSTKAAESASKLHLESIKKVAKLEAECRRLQAMVRKASLAHHQNSTSISSVNVESYADSLSDHGDSPQVTEADIRKKALNEFEGSNSDSWASSQITELGQLKDGKSSAENLIALTNEIILMDDFLEMEKLAALPDTESPSCFVEMESTVNKKNRGGSSLKAELEFLTQRNAELEVKLEKMEAERVEVERAFSDCHLQLETTRSQLEKTEFKLTELQSQLALTSRLTQDASEELKVIKTKNENTESELRKIQSEKNHLISEIGVLEAEIQIERNLTAANMAKITKLENELSNMKHETEIQREVETLQRERTHGELKLKQEKQLAVAASSFAECQKTIASLDRQLKSLATLEELMLESEELMLESEELVLESERPSDFAYIGEDVENKKGREQPQKIQSTKRGFSTLISSNTNSPISYDDRNRSGLCKFFPRSKSVIKTRSR